MRMHDRPIILELEKNLSPVEILQQIYVYLRQLTGWFTQDIKCDDVGNWRNNSNDKFYFSVECMDENSAQVTAAESSDPDVATLKREYYMLKHDNGFKKRIDILFRE